MTKQELIETTGTLIAAESCCQELKSAAQAWLDAVGKDGEKAAAEAFLKELKEDVCTIDDAPVSSVPRRPSNISARKRPRSWKPWANRSRPTAASGVSAPPAPPVRNCWRTRKPSRKTAARVKTRQGTGDTVRPPPVFFVVLRQKRGRGGRDGQLLGRPSSTLYR